LNARTNDLLLLRSQLYAVHKAIAVLRANVEQSIAKDPALWAYHVAPISTALGSLLDGYHPLDPRPVKSYEAFAEGVCCGFEAPDPRFSCVVETIAFRDEATREGAPAGSTSLVGLEPTFVSPAAIWIT